eukprot:COSAG04_NODE_962_length_9154_cov_68.379680_11_plen_76_part_00
MTFLCMYTRTSQSVMLHAPPIHHSIDGAAACKAPARALQKVARVVAEKESTGRHVLLRVSSDHWPFFNRLACFKA